MWRLTLDCLILHPPSAMKLNMHLKERTFTACAHKEMEVGDSVILECFNPLLIQQDQPVSSLKPSSMVVLALAMR